MPCERLRGYQCRARLRPKHRIRSEARGRPAIGTRKAASVRTLAQLLDAKLEIHGALLRE